MKKKIIFGIVVFVFLSFAVIYSYLQHGKKVSENTSGTSDGKILICRKYSQIDKIIAIDSADKSHKVQINDFTYDETSLDLIVKQDLSNFTDPIFHVEGKPSESQEFLLRSRDSSKGPTAVFLNGTIAALNREYIIDEEKNILTLKVPTKEVVSISVIYHTKDGMASFSEISEKEMDLYAELQGAWFTENIKNKLSEQTTQPYLKFDGDVPKIAFKNLSKEEIQKQLDEVPVTSYKFRKEANMKKLSKELGFNVKVPEKIGEYKLVSTMIIESSVKGEKTKSVEFSYDKTDFFSLDSIAISASKITSQIEQEIEHLIEKSIVQNDKKSVQKRIYWSILSTENSYAPQKMCLFDWTENETLYQISCPIENEKKIEEFILESTY